MHQLDGGEEVLGMVEQSQAQRRGRVLGGVRPTGEDHRATTFELFFDLVYVFAATQVTGYMAHEHSGHGVLQGLLLLALLWGTWSAYAWLGNQARADEGLLRRAWLSPWRPSLWSLSPFQRPGRTRPAA
jgi:low temperature requirement protein LtrA